MLHSTKYRPIFVLTNEIGQMKSALKYRTIQMLIALIFVFGTANAQTSMTTTISADLYKEIFHEDSLLFAAFNSRNVEAFKNYFTEDLEFYHDKGGLTNYDHTINFLITTAKQNSNLKRELVKGSLEVYPIQGYGAMEIGQHQFCHTENGKNDCGIFKFVQVWQKKDDQWKVTRVISYDHK